MCYLFRTRMYYTSSYLNCKSHLQIVSFTDRTRFPTLSLSLHAWLNTRNAEPKAHVNIEYIRVEVSDK